MDLLEDIRSEIATVAGCLWQKGWAEKNAGNISVDVSELADVPDAAASVVCELRRPHPELAGRVFLVTGAGTRMRDVAAKPGETTCLIMVSERGDGSRILKTPRWNPDLRPTSELATHLAIHRQLRGKKAPPRAVVHTHPDELIALTQISEYNDEKRLNALLWRMHPEAVIVNPEGVGLIPYRLPGSEEIAEKTASALARLRIVIWEKHGCVAVGRGVNEAFDLIDVVCKSARLFFLCRRAGVEPEGLTVQQIEELRTRAG